MVYSKYLRYIIDLFVKHISKKEVSFISHIMKQNDEIKSWNRLKNESELEQRLAWLI